MTNWKVFLGGLSVLLFVACQEDNTTKEELNASKIKQEELYRELAERDTVITDFINTLLEIDHSLGEIRNLEQSLTAVDGIVDASNADEKILENIQKIKEHMEKNKQELERKRKEVQRLRKNSKGDQQRIAQLEQLIESLNRRIMQKDEELMALRNELGDLNVEYVEIFDAYLEKSAEYDSLVLEVGKVYYTMGSFKELKENNVLDKEGGVIGLGSVKKLKSDFNKGYFEEVDMNTFAQLDLMSSKAELVTEHPTDSYEIQDVNAHKKQLVIKDPKAFWSVSRFLVVLIK